MRAVQRSTCIFSGGIWLEWQRQSKTGMLPSLPALILKQLPFFSPWYNPVHEGSTEEALAYLEGSPAAAAAQTAKHAA